jgi:hypothetical protein
MTLFSTIAILLGGYCAGHLDCAFRRTPRKPRRRVLKVADQSIPITTPREFHTDPNEIAWSEAAQLAARKINWEAN